MKKLFPLLLLALLISSCEKYRIVNFGCKGGCGGSGNDGTFFVPNIFTPNGDGSNDFFQLFHNERDTIAISSFYIVVKNALGTKVFESYDPNFLWNGTKNGKSLKDDVYQVKLSYNSISSSGHGGLHNVKGSLTLYRGDFKKLCAKHFDACQYGSQWDGNAYNGLLPTNEFYEEVCD